MEAFPRTIFDDVHQQFRATFRSWLDKEVVPNHEKWEEEGITPRELWLEAG
jgi:acyl-CoA dehydrogenase